MLNFSRTLTLAEVLVLFYLVVCTLLKSQDFLACFDQKKNCGECDYYLNLVLRSGSYAAETCEPRQI